MDSLKYYLIYKTHAINESLFKTSLTSNILPKTCFSDHYLWILIGL